MMNRYFEEMVLSASPVELIRLLYQKAIDSTRKAREHLREGRIGERSAAINNVYLIVAELSASLKPEEAPELTAHLGTLYSYLQRRLLEANMTQTDQPLADVLSILLTLSEAWVEPATPDQPSVPWTGSTALGDETAQIAYSA